MKMSPPDRGIRRNIWIVPAALAALVLVVYAPVVHHPFQVTDDQDYVTANRHVQAASPSGGGGRSPPDAATGTP